VNAVVRRTTKGQGSAGGHTDAYVPDSRCGGIHWTRCWLGRPALEKGIWCALGASTNPHFAPKIGLGEQPQAKNTMTFNVHRPMLVLLLVPLVGLLRAQAVATHGPSRGTLILQGGVGLNRSVASAFVARAGGPRSHIVVIPTAMVGNAGPPGDWRSHIARRVKEEFGVATVTVLHTIDRADADVDTFVEPLRKATGVWIFGGFPPNLVHAYLGTKTERAIKELLERGGVVGGESAGAMIQGSWLDTTDSEWTPEIHGIIQKHATGAGLGLLTNAAVFPHFDERGPADAERESAAHPDQLAIGIDSATALIVSGALADVVGAGTVSMYDGSGRSAPNVVILRSGDRYDLSTRRKQ